MTNFELVHSFAHQEKAKARTKNGNMFYHGTQLYSYGYHYKLAELKKKGAETYVVINDSGYSSTTQRHIALTISATSHLKQFFLSDFQHDFVRDFLQEQVRKLVVARKPELYISAINSKIEKFNAYYSYIPEAKKDIAYKNSIKEIRELAKVVNSEKALDAVKKLEKKRKAKEKKQRAEVRALGIVRFMNYKVNYVITDVDVLRVSIDGQSIETTQGLRFSIDDCRQLYGAILKGAVKKDSKFKHYTVTSIDKKILKIGCHNLCMDSVHAIGKQISG